MSVQGQAEAAAGAPGAAGAGAGLGQRPHVAWQKLPASMKSAQHLPNPFCRPQCKTHSKAWATSLTATRSSHVTCCYKVQIHAAMQEAMLACQAGRVEAKAMAVSKTL